MQNLSFNRGFIRILLVLSVALVAISLMLDVDASVSILNVSIWLSTDVILDTLEGLNKENK